MTLGKPTGKPALVAPAAMSAKANVKFRGQSRSERRKQSVSARCLKSNFSAAAGAAKLQERYDPKKPRRSGAKSAMWAAKQRRKRRCVNRLAVEAEVSGRLLTRFLEDTAFGPDEIAVMVAAYELGLTQITPAATTVPLPSSRVVDRNVSKTR